MMIKLPKEIAYMIKTIEDAGYEAYAVGGCVRDSILGRHPEDWDLTSNASRDTLEALFPGASIVNKKLGVMRITEKGITADIAAYRIDGEYKDYRRPETVIFTEDIGEDLRRRDFTMNAVAVSPGGGVVDPYRGREDIKRKLIRGIGDPRVRFEEDALRILRAVRFAAQLDFEIEADTLRAMKEKAGLLAHISVERIREEFVKTVTSANSGKGLKLTMESGLLPYVFGGEFMKNASKPELARLAESIDRSKPEPGFRLALIYQCLDRECALAAIEWLGYSNEMKKLFRYAVSLTEELEQITDKTDLKRFINRIGWEHYQYLRDLSEQRLRIYQPDVRNGDRLDEAAFLRREELIREVQDNKEPVFIGDLAVSGEDLKRSGIGEGVMVGRILTLLLETVHQAPEKNETELLLKIAAEKYAEHK
jgi:tRNA nucleotidyltransferase (CCA-adding enzyme)